MLRKIFELTVFAQEPSAQDHVDAASNALMIGYAVGETNTNVTQDVTLSTNGADGVEIRWSSTDSNVIAPNGEVTPPVFGEPDAMVSLTATLSKEGATAMKPFELTVLAVQDPSAQGAGRCGKQCPADRLRRGGDQYECDPRCNAIHKWI